MSPTVTIIIPNYNHALYLKQRIDSVLNQTFQDFEIIILDDCSVDNSREIIEGYRAHPKMNRIVYNEENSGGVFKQWVKGIEMATGKYIWIAESDDYTAPTFLEETVKVLETDDETGMVFTNTSTVTANGKFITTTAESKAVSYAELNSLHNFIDGENAPRFLVSEMIIENASSVLFRKSVLLKLDLKELVSFSNTGDRFVYIGMALQSKIIYLPLALNFMRSHDTNTTKTGFDNGNIHRDRLKVLNYYFHQLYRSSAYGKKIGLFYKKNYISFLTYGTNENNIELLEKMKTESEVTTVFYYLVRSYLYLLRKTAGKTGISRRLLYRLLVMQHAFDKEYQK